MTLKEAIKFNTNWQKRILEPENSAYRVALRLGIEALQLNLEMRFTYSAPQLLKLPSETDP